MFTPERVRNFCIVAHIDHGKTTLSTKLMEDTGTIVQNEKNAMFLDKLQVEKERGITVKAQTCSMFHTFVDEATGSSQELLLNLIDTPGHVDFSYEVSRSLVACESAVLLVDGTQGVQAQTVSNLFLALDAGLEIVPVLNKCDMESMKEVLDATREDLRSLLMLDDGESEVMAISARTGLGVDKLLAHLERLPAPASHAVVEGKKCDKLAMPFRCVMFDNWHDPFRGIVCMMRVLEGAVKKGETISSVHTGQSYEVAEVGIMHPGQQPTHSLQAGQVGYVILGMKDTKEAKVGDTFFHKGVPVEPMPGFKDVQPMVFAGIYPLDSDQFDDMKDAMQKLVLNDAGVTVHPESSSALGSGFRCGFLGLLHMEVFMQRMEQEFAIPVLATAPSVPYKLEMKDGTERLIENPADFPDAGDDVAVCLEPTVRATIIAPSEYLGGLIRLCQDREGEQEALEYLDKSRLRLVYRIPLGEIVVDFYDKLKQISSGYASFDYEDAGYQKASRVKIGVRLDGNVIEPLASVCTTRNADKHARAIVHKLKEQIPKQQHEVAIQAIMGQKVLARATVKAVRKDVTAKCYGGDVSRKRKLLEKQKEGKKRMKQLGRVHVTKETFINVLKRD